jgi:hypothetical protein
MQKDRLASKAELWQLRERRSLLRKFALLRQLVLAQIPFNFRDHASSGWR